MLNLIVVFRNPSDAEKIRALLMRNGFPVHSVSNTGMQAIAQIDNLRTGIVICGYQLKDMLYSELRENLPDGFEMLLMAKADVLPSAQGEGIVSLPFPVRTGDLIETIEMIRGTIEERKEKKRHRNRYRTGEDRKLVEQAKLLLMDRNHMTEPEAHHYLQKSAMNSGNSMIETAQMVLELYR